MVEDFLEGLCLYSWPLSVEMFALSVGTYDDCIALVSVLSLASLLIRICDGVSRWDYLCIV